MPIFTRRGLPVTGPRNAIAHRSKDQVMRNERMVADTDSNRPLGRRRTDCQGVGPMNLTHAEYDAMLAKLNQATAGWQECAIELGESRERVKALEALLREARQEQERVSKP